METQLRPAIVLLAAGSGSRFGNPANKVWIPLGGRRIISRSLMNATKSFPRARIVLVINKSDQLTAKKVLARETPQLKVEIILGGATRHESEFNALEYLKEDIELDNINVVIIHDGARPLATSSLFRKITDSAFLHGGAIPVIMMEPRETDPLFSVNLARVQTPQAFHAKELLIAYEAADRDGFSGTDTSACMEKYFPGHKVVAVIGEVHNVKITYPQDLVIAAHILEKRRYKD